MLLPTAAVRSEEPNGDAGSGADPWDQALDPGLLDEVLILLDDGEETPLTELALEQLLRDAAALRANPLDVNTAGLQELLRVPLIDPATAVRIVAHRTEWGPYGSLDDLAAAGVEPHALEALRPYLIARPLPDSGGTALKPHAEVSGTSAAGPVSWSVRARAGASGWDEDTTPAPGVAGLGGHLGTYARFRMRLPHGISLGIACEKDSGEAALLDHAAFHVRWDAPGDDGPIVGVGDFVASWAQGLVMAGGGFVSTGALPRRHDRVRGYDGAGEAIARRGIFVDVSRAAVRVIGVGARTALDAAIEDGLVTTIRATGYHRTAGERLGAGALTETLLGARVVVDVATGVDVGASLVRLGFDPPIGPGDFERQRFRFHGNAVVVASTDVRLDAGPWRFGAEVAGNGGGGRAAVAAGRLVAGDARASAGFGYLSRDYWSPLGGGVPSFGGGSNGASGWIRAEYRRRGAWSAWIEGAVAWRPWRSYNLTLPDRWASLAGGGTLDLGKLGSVLADFRTLTRSVEEGEPTETLVATSRRTRFRYRTKSEPACSFTLGRTSSSLEEADVGSLTSLGVAITADLGNAWSLASGATTVVASGAPRPVIQYEPRLPGEFGLVTLNEPGTRWYIRVQAGLLRGIGVSIRCAGGPERGDVEFGIGIDARGPR